MKNTNYNRFAKADFSVSFGLLSVIFFFVASGAVSYWNLHTLVENSSAVRRTHEVIAGLSELLSLAKDAETGQRGFLITGDERYLEPYNTALKNIDAQENTIEHALGGNETELGRLTVIKNHIADKLKELNDTIILRRQQGFDAARAVVVTDHGKNEMDAIREQMAAIESDQEQIRAERLASMDSAYRVAIVSGLLTCLLGIVVSAAVAQLMRRNIANRKKQEWLQSGQLGLGAAVFGEQNLHTLGENVLKFLTGYVDAHAGAFFVQDGTIFKRMALYGTPNSGDVPEQFNPGEGLLGQVAKEGKVIFLRNVPEGYLAVSSALGQGNPRHLVIAPIAEDGKVNGVMELGFIHPLDELTIKLLEELSKPVAIAIKSAHYRVHLQNLLEETQRQAEELQAQGEELRVSNEELSEQSRALKESQTRLEQQHAELEQTNAQLEEQTQQLEAQRDDLERAKSSVQTKAQELEQASRYKSDFLANMSHELRTPLNSSLILAKLLSDNPDGNLTSEQVKYAETIRSSGNDLLTLINDILDLSKIEAGHMEIKPEPMSLSRLTNDLTRLFEPVAKQKGIVFEAQIDKNCPQTIDTDRQRLEQIIKNLLSNAFKFTEKGKVNLTIKQGEPGHIALVVSDTGIGISQNQQQAIFDAFRQADSTISRKYGGTGLGLSISRELARLLSGDISLESEAGKGSCFTLTIPEVYDAALVRQRPLAIASQHTEQSMPDSASLTQFGMIEDDRDHLSSTSRIILVIEDDEPFAKILYDLAHELDFQCLIATTAEEALLLSKQYLPHAVVLDVGLPDNSGLFVLDRLKHDTKTRHVPVHVVSAGDYSQTAFSLGAAGYMLKPVKRETLSDAFKKLEQRLSQHMRRVLIVEDEEVQRDSVKRLLTSQDVETVAVGSAAECLEQLKSSTFDCMVLDLSLPDATGYSLLETLSQEHNYSFPPVIVYTARDLTSADEQKLRRYSKSIIIKGAKSPERLLDEVTLFLHQVVSDLPPEQQRMLEKAKHRDAVLEERHILVVEDDVRNVYALTSILEPRGAVVHIARNGREALDILEQSQQGEKQHIDLVLMDVMMPEMDGMTATREIRKRSEWKKIPIIMLTAKAMKDDQERCLASGANDYMAKPIDVEKLLSLVRVWMPR